MRRREFLSVVAMLAAPCAVTAQQTGPVRRMGVLFTSAGPNPAGRAIFIQTLRDLGWIDGQNLSIEYRYANNNVELVPALATELVRLKVDVIVTIGSVASLAAKRATTTIPIVASSGDPVLVGLVTSLSRPGGNITGTSTTSPELTAKRLQFLKGLLPSATRIGELVNPANPQERLMRTDYERVYRSVDLQPIFVEVTRADQLEGAIAEFARQRTQALVVRADPLFLTNRDTIMQLAVKHALPTMTEGRQFVAAGGLVSYAPNGAEQIRRSAALVDKILRGAKPGDLPFEQPTTFELVINLKTAKTLGITIPQSLLLLADEVMQ
jgi:putative ABC transport system substrate-binding protein